MAASMPTLALDEGEAKEEDEKGSPRELPPRSAPTCTVEAEKRETRKRCEDHGIARGKT